MDKGPSLPTFPQTMAISTAPHTVYTLKPTQAIAPKYKAPYSAPKNVRLGDAVLRYLFLHIHSGREKTYDWLKLTEVCRSWRSVALRTPALWQHLSFGPGPSFLRMFWNLLALSRENLVSITLDATDTDDWCRDMFFSGLRLHYSRIVLLRIRFNGGSKDLVRELLYKSFPRLMELHLEAVPCVYDLPCIVLRLPPFLTLPNVTSITLSSAIVLPKDPSFSVGGPSPPSFWKTSRLCVKNTDSLGPYAESGNATMALLERTDGIQDLFLDHAFPGEKYWKDAAFDSSSDNVTVCDRRPWRLSARPTTHIPAKTPNLMHLRTLCMYDRPLAIQTFLSTVDTDTLTSVELGFDLSRVPERSQIVDDSVLYFPFLVWDTVYSSKRESLQRLVGQTFSLQILLPATDKWHPCMRGFNPWTHTSWSLSFGNGTPAQISEIFLDGLQDIINIIADCYYGFSSDTTAALLSHLPPAVPPSPKKSVLPHLLHELEIHDASPAHAGILRNFNWPALLRTFPPLLHRLVIGGARTTAAFHDALRAFLPRAHTFRLTTLRCCVDSLPAARSGLIATLHVYAKRTMMRRLELRVPVGMALPHDVEQREGAQHEREVLLRWCRTGGAPVEIAQVRCSVCDDV